MPLQAVMIDHNGTSFDDLKPLVYPSICSIFRHFRVRPPSLTTYRDEITAQFIDFYHAHGIPRHVTGDQLNALRKNYFEAHWQKGRFRKGFLSFLQFCRRKNLLIASVSAEVEFVLKRKLREASLIGFFNRVHGNARDKESALVETLDCFGIKAEDAVYLDDTFDGLISAKNLGMKTIGFTAGYNTKKRILAAHPDFPDKKLFRAVNSMHQATKVIEFMLGGKV